MCEFPLAGIGVLSPLQPHHLDLTRQGPIYASGGKSNAGPGHLSIRTVRMIGMLIADPSIPSKDTYFFLMIESDSFAIKFFPLRDE